MRQIGDSRDIICPAMIATRVSSPNGSSSAINPESGSLQKSTAAGIAPSNFVPPGMDV